MTSGYHEHALDHEHALVVCLGFLRKHSPTQALKFFTKSTGRQGLSVTDVKFSTHRD